MSTKSQLLPALETLQVQLGRFFFFPFFCFFPSGPLILIVGIMVLHEIVSFPSFPIFQSFPPRLQLWCSLDPLQVSGCHLSGSIEDFFRMLIHSTRISQISASGCNLTGTLKDPSSFRQRTFRLRNSESNKKLVRTGKYICRHGNLYYVDLCGISVVQKCILLLTHVPRFTCKPRSKRGEGTPRTR